MCVRIHVVRINAWPIHLVGDVCVFRWRESSLLVSGAHDKIPIAMTRHFRLGSIHLKFQLMTIKTLLASTLLSSCALVAFAQSAPAVDGGNSYAPNQAITSERAVAKPAHQKVKHQASHQSKHQTKKHHKARSVKKHKKSHSGHSTKAKAKGPGLQAY